MKPIVNALMKRKKVVLAGVFLGLVLFSGTSFSQMLSDWEFNVYYDFIAKFFNMEDWSKESEDGVCREVADKYNISYGQVYDIIDRAYEREPSDWEWDVGEELYERFSSAPENLQTDSERDRIFREFENRYGVSRNYLNDILYRTMWDIMMGDY